MYIFEPNRYKSVPFEKGTTPVTAFVPLFLRVWSSGQPALRRPGSSRGFGALLKGLTSVVDNSSRSRDSNPQPRVTSPTLYPLGNDCPDWMKYYKYVISKLSVWLYVHF